MAESSTNLAMLVGISYSPIPWCFRSFALQRKPTTVQATVVPIGRRDMIWTSLQRIQIAVPGGPYDNRSVNRQISEDSSGNAADRTGKRARKMTS